MSDYFSRCRLCTSKKSHGKNLFLPRKGRESYAELIMKVFQIQVFNSFIDYFIVLIHLNCILVCTIQLEDKKEWPSVACKLCIRLLDGILDFKMDIETSQTFFNDRVFKPSDAEQVTVNEASTSDQTQEDPSEEYFQEQVEYCPDPDTTDGYEAMDSPSDTPVPLPVQRRKKTSFPCETCGKVVTTKYSLEKHVKLHLPVEQREKYICEICGKEFLARPYLSQHMTIIHKRTTSEECPLCHKFFFSVKEHIKRVHTERKRVPCPVCGKEVVCLKQHLTAAHVNGNEVCNTCGKSFATLDSLRTHELTHTGQRWPCEFCAHTSSSERNLGTHLRQRHAVEYEARKAKRYSEPVVRS